MLPRICSVLCIMHVQSIDPREFTSCWSDNRYLSRLRHTNTFGAAPFRPPGLFRTRLAFDETEFCRVLTTGNSALSVAPVVAALQAQDFATKCEAVFGPLCTEQCHTLSQLFDIVDLLHFPYAVVGLNQLAPGVSTNPRQGTASNPLKSPTATPYRLTLDGCLACMLHDRCVPDPLVLTETAQTKPDSAVYDASNPTRTQDELSANTQRSSSGTQKILIPLIH